MMIWDFQDALSRRLLLWSTLSVAVGAVLLWTGSEFWRGFGLQALVWGLIDGAIAGFGRRNAARRRARGPYSAEALAREAANMRRILWINTGLDVLYVTGGLILAFTAAPQNLFVIGNGWGIVVQGGFLFFFDLIHVFAVPRKGADLTALNGFSGPEHAPFHLGYRQSPNGRESPHPGDPGPAALLVHGFGGTPAEMRALAEALHREGWTAEAILLPGFGADIATLTARQFTDWLDAVAAAAQRLRDAGHRPLLLVGYSMGATLALTLAPTIRPDGLVVLAPFWWEEKPWTPIVEFFVRPFLPIGFRPLRGADFRDPRVRQGIAKLIPGLNLDDPATQAAIRDLELPLSLIDQLRALSRRMWTMLPQVRVPALVVQGTRDVAVRASQTQKLLRRLRSHARYVEVDAEHDLVLPENPAWPQVAAAVISFAQALTSGLGKGSALQR
jgi:esterase/lipase